MRGAATAAWSGQTVANTKGNGCKASSMALVRWLSLTEPWRREYLKTMCSKEKCLLRKLWNTDRARKVLPRRKQYHYSTTTYLLYLSIIWTQMVINIELSKNGCRDEQEAQALCLPIIIKWDQLKQVRASTNLNNKVPVTPTEIAVIISRQIKVQNQRAFISMHQIQTLNQGVESEAQLH